MLAIPSFSQTSVSRLRQDADKAYHAGDFRKALQYYRQAGLESSKDKKLRQRIGISMYEMSELDRAIQIFQSLINEGKTDAFVFFYIAKCYQAKNQYLDAITSYKKYLQRADEKDDLRPWIKDELTRSANGARMRYADQLAYVENAGPVINTPYDEFGAQNSPTFMEKIYFNSDRSNTSVNHSRRNTDIYSASLINGTWTVPTPMPSHINSTAYEEVRGFSGDGQVIYFLTSKQTRFTLMADTLSGEDGLFYQGVFSGPYEDAGTVSDFTFFNDSICLFSSKTSGGYGGYDLYISMLRNRQWTNPVNLGPTINSFYDERYPFLARNGETLFFSSNNLHSVGGLDIFKAVFDDSTLTWSVPENLGFPINSSLDDSHLVISPDGMTAFISSNRKEGHGETDLYRVFFKQPVHAHQQISMQPTFYNTMLMHGAEQISIGHPEPRVEVKEYFISHLFLEENGEVLTPQNVKKLDLLANLLLIYPRIKAELSCFELPTGQRTFNLYFSIKKAEKAAEYLERKGVPRNRLNLKGYGSSFPLAKNMAGGSNNLVYLKLNHRIEIGIHDFESEPVITHLENIPVPDHLLDPRGAKFLAYRHGMYYGVQIASIPQILQNTSLETVEEMFIEVDHASGNYMYMAGIQPTYAEAADMLAHMKSLGFYDAAIIPYLDGIRLKQDEIPGIATEYPDLLNYLETKNK